ncbi:MAG TPA: hypothetical protein VII13_17330, partial [Vicinamibacteria bacterium]
MRGLLGSLLLAVACCACAGPPGPDLAGWAWTYSQTELGGALIRYGYPDEREPEDAAAATGAAGAAFLPPPAGARESRFASYRYD